MVVDELRVTGAEPDGVETVFLVCFLFGALFALLSVVLGFLGGAFHHPGHTGHAPHLQQAHDVAHGAVHAGHGAHGDSASDTLLAHLPVLNASALLAFLAWFGAAGYLLTRFTGWPLVAILVVAVAAGLVAALIIGAVLGRVLAGERVMRPEDYRLDGTPARVTVRIPAGGVGEIVFSKAGARRSEAARSLDGGEIPRDVEVVIIDYTGGIALVETVDQLLSRPEPPRLAGR
jgi:hypothetical protein